MSDTPNPQQPCDHGAVTDHHNGSITCDQCGAEVVWSHHRFAWITGKVEPSTSTRPAMAPEVAKMAKLPRAAKHHSPSMNIQITISSNSEEGDIKRKYNLETDQDSGSSLLCELLSNIDAAKPNCATFNFGQSATVPLPPQPPNAAPELP